MSVATVSSKGQITIPARARQHLGIKVHDRVLIETRSDEIVIRPTTTFMRLQGFLGRPLVPAEERSAMAKRVAAHTRSRS